MKCIKLSGSSGVKMPVVGLGTWQTNAETTENSVWTALQNGYRHIDTAFNYNNEETIGITLKKWFNEGNGKREDLFITTKLPHIGNRASDVDKFLTLSLKRLQLDYLDLYLIHLPIGFHYNSETLTPLINEDGTYVLDQDTDHVGTWKALEQQVSRGRIKELGVSNFNSQQLKRIYDSATIKPSVLQVELHAYLQQPELRALCEQLNVVVTAYSPLGSPGAKTHFVSKYNYNPDKFPDILGHPTVLEISTACKKSPAQILLRHLIQLNITAIPKSSNPQRIKENIDIFDFELTQDQIEKLNGLDQGEAGRIFNFFFWKGVENHKEYPFVKLCK